MAQRGRRGKSRRGGLSPPRRATEPPRRASRLWALVSASDAASGLQLHRRRLEITGGPPGCVHGKGITTIETAYHLQMTQEVENIRGMNTELISKSEGVLHTVTPR